MSENTNVSVAPMKFFYTRQLKKLECFQILTWLNPAANVKVSEEDDFEPAIAIKSEMFGLFHSVSRTVS